MKGGDSHPPSTTEKRGKNRKGVPATKKQRAAMADGTKTAAQNRTERKRARTKAATEAKALGIVEKPRWKKLEDGDISVGDLDLKELVKGEVANNDGSWDGKRHQLTPRMQQKMYTEFKRKFRRDFDNLAPLALEAYEEILEDSDNPAQRWAAVKTMVEYQQGKVPEVIHVGPESEYDRLTQSAFVILRGEENVKVDDDDQPDIVDAELVEE